MPGETAKQRLMHGWPGIFSSEDLWSAVNVGVRHAETPHIQCMMSAMPAPEQGSRKDEGSNGILCYIVISRSAWAAEDPVLRKKKKVTPNQIKTKGRFSRLSVQWFHYRGVESALNFILLPRGCR